MWLIPGKPLDVPLCFHISENYNEVLCGVCVYQGICMCARFFSHRFDFAAASSPAATTVPKPRESDAPANTWSDKLCV